MYNGLIATWVLPINLANRWVEEGLITEQSLIEYYLDETGTAKLEFIKKENG